MDKIGVLVLIANITIAQNCVGISVDEDNNSMIPPEVVSKECEHQNFCMIKPNNYPQEKIDQLFGKLKLNLPHHVEINDSTIDHRDGNGIGSNDCAHVFDYDPIYTVRDNDGRTRTVVQSTKENFLQRIRLERCSNVGERCFKSFQSPDMITKCVDKTMDFSIMVLSLSKEDDFERIPVTLPVSCSCRYKFISSNDNSYEECTN